jgi:large subunit ribosomal protein L22
MRLVAGIVKGMPVEKALGILNFTPKIAAHHLAKTVKSAAANALSQEGTDHLRPEDLLIKNIIVDEAPTAKRIRFRSMGRVFRYNKRFCHLTVLIEGESDIEVEQKKVAKPAKAAKTEAAKVEAKPKKEVKKKAATKKKTVKKVKASDDDKKKAAPKKKAAVKKTAKKKVVKGDK